MIEKIKILDEKFFKQIGLNISKIKTEPETEAYSGFNFKLNNVGVKFRRGKITPKKSGFFVTLWRRNNHGITEPFSADEPFELLIIAVEEQEKSGFFVFTKPVLIETKILRNNAKDGKRGFRIYNQWQKVLSSNAEKTRKQQIEHFIDLTDDEADNLDKFQKLTAHIFK